MRRVLVILMMGAVAAGLVVAARWYTQRDRPAEDLAIYGNVEFRQAALPFNGTERIVEMLVEEGDRVEAGQVLARVETRRLAAQEAEARATVAAQRAAVARLRHGTRPEEVAQARAQVQAAEAEVLNARQEHERLVAIESSFEGRAISKREVQDARAALVTAEAAMEVARRGLALAEVGPRQEDIDQAEAQLQAAEARLRFQHQLLVDAELKAPADGVIRSRLMEPGEITAPQRPVYSLAIADPKWVRAYVSGEDLGRVAPGMTAIVRTDTFPGRGYEGWIGFISPVAEFTPKPVQTEALRTSLVYEVRVFVHDPRNELRLGMPATVQVGRTEGGPASRPAPATQGALP